MYIKKFFFHVKLRNCHADIFQGIELEACNTIKLKKEWLSDFKLQEFK